MDETATRAQRAIRRSIVIAVVGAVVGGVGSAIGGVRLEKGSDVVLLAIGGTITVAGLAGLVSVFLTLIDLLPERPDARSTEHAARPSSCRSRRRSSSSSPA
ncbi:hypothetical protein [Curtobacterium sp. AG1037]|uniref:hypothetical protein n=1 Tax=Curtobacterium sp. AG1037 TaxID=2183990 RepID=UPI000E0A8A0F|nr:hypothetical protein [Curtobacterium sp. AG1037]